METKQDIAYLEVPTAAIDIEKNTRSDGSILLRSSLPLDTYPEKITERLRYWADKNPEKILLAQRDADGNWYRLTYAEVWKKMLSVAQFLIDSGADKEHPIVVLSGNSWQHALLALAAQHVGIPFSAISSAYSLKSKDYKKLKHCIQLLTPGLVFVQDGQRYQNALNAVLGVDTPLVVAENPINGSMLFDQLLGVSPTKAVEQAHKQLTADTIAKILFTSGSTGMPKGVINTQGNLSCNLQQITQTYPFMANGGLLLMDWLPWSHTFGGNHNFGLVFYNGGTLYIDEGNPTPAGTEITVRNLQEIAPTVYFNVPKGFEELVVQLEQDKNFCSLFFSQLKMLFFGGASLSQHVRDRLDALALRTVGKRILISSGYGMTEACPSTMFNTRYDQLSGNLGVPVPGISAKLVPCDDAFEVRFKGPNLTPGYWRDDLQTKNAFDEEGYFKSGDALKFQDAEDANQGLVYDGRITENFKLNTGTWVNVGLLRTQLINKSNGIIKDVVLTGHDQSFVGALLFLDANMRQKMTLEELRLRLIKALTAIFKRNTGASTFVKKALIADFEPSAKRGELTEKGSINQRAVLTNRKDWVAKIYHEPSVSEILEI
ncbi:feruloyl-CoA synthase [Cytophaga sp. FL35]|uniref:feruloyl-CoA synthase n=1 Tax=Cytophaga sp. FL35 TaxID=1904456 RepID=UPI00256FA78A|nr:feruloyl-CoA synthase [Cytophaga sp. FL35]